MNYMYPIDKTCDVCQYLSKFVYNDHLCQLVESFGGKYPKKSLEEDLDYLLNFSNKWDYRNNKKTKTETNENARWLISSDSLSKNQKNCIDNAKKSLGLIDNAVPQKDYYDYIWVLGGAKLSCLLRSQLAKEIYFKLKNQPKKIALLGSLRLINDSERIATDTYAKFAKNEFDLFISARKSVFGESKIKFQQEGGAQNEQWKIIEYEDNISILASPSSDPINRRANSLDTYLFFIDKYDVQPLESILLITSEIYVPYQHLEAYRSIVLKKNVIIETVGFPSKMGGKLQGMNSDENFLQEIRSTIQSYYKLYKEINN